MSKNQQQGGRYVAIARILSAVGTEGWVRTESLSHSSSRFEQLERVYAARTLDEEYPIPLAVDEVQVEPDRIDLAFLGITDATKAQELTDYYLLIPEEERAELGEDHYYIDDLQGLRVVDSSGADIGVVLKVLPNPANDLLKIRRSNGKQILLPMVKAFIELVDLEEGRIIVNLPSGLEEI